MQNNPIIQINISCHWLRHDLGWISAYLKEGTVWDNILEVTNFRIEKLSFLSPWTNIDFRNRL